MSAVPELAAEPITRGSVKIAMNAKHEPQFEVKVYIEDTIEEILAAKEAALSVYRELERELGYAKAAP
jgi:hypothetical protein